MGSDIEESAELFRPRSTRRPEAPTMVRNPDSTTGINDLFPDDARTVAAEVSPVDQAFKTEVVERVLSGQWSIFQVCNEHGVAKSEIIAWLAAETGVRVADNGIDELVDDERAELARLRRENEKLRGSVDLLTQAAAQLASLKDE